MQIYLKYPEGVDGRVKNGKYSGLERDRKHEYLKYPISRESHNEKMRRYRAKKRELGYAISKSSQISLTK